MITGEYMHNATVFMNAKIGSPRWINALKTLIRFAAQGDDLAASAKSLLLDTLGVKITTDETPRAANDSAIVERGAIGAAQ